MHSMKNANPISQSSRSALKHWVLAARPKTLVAGISPVLIGASFAARAQPISYGDFALCLLFSVLIQIGTNWANDYFDFMKGADTATRKGPARAVQSGWIAPLAMRNGAFSAFGLAILCALPLLLRLGFAYLPLALLCPLLGTLYTGGKRPLGYMGLGDLLVFVFYGPVATCATALVLHSGFSKELFLASLAPGLLSSALLAVNNLRDWEEDRKCGKMTLVARFGPVFGKAEYLACLILGIGFVPFSLSMLRLWWLAPLAVFAARLVFKGEHQKALPATSALLALYTLSWCYAVLYL